MLRLFDIGSEVSTVRGNKRSWGPGTDPRNQNTHGQKPDARINWDDSLGNEWVAWWFNLSQAPEVVFSLYDRYSLQKTGYTRTRAGKEHTQTHAHAPEEEDKRRRKKKKKRHRCWHKDGLKDGSKDRNQINSAPTNAPSITVLCTCRSLQKWAILRSGLGGRACSVHTEYGESTCRLERSLE